MSASNNMDPFYHPSQIFKNRIQAQASIFLQKNSVDANMTIDDLKVIANSGPAAVAAENRLRHYDAHSDTVMHIFLYFYVLYLLRNPHFFLFISS